MHKCVPIGDMENISDWKYQGTLYVFEQADADIFGIQFDDEGSFISIGEVRNNNVCDGTLVFKEDVLKLIKALQQCYDENIKEEQ